MPAPPTAGDLELTHGVSGRMGLGGRASGRLSTRREEGWPRSRLRGDGGLAPHQRGVPAARGVSSCSAILSPRASSLLRSCVCVSVYECVCECVCMHL